MSLRNALLAAGPGANDETANIIMLFVSVLAICVGLWVFVRIIGRAGKVQTKALEQIERSFEHMQRAEQHMEKQERETERIAQLLESIDATLKKR